MSRSWRRRAIAAHLDMSRFWDDPFFTVRPGDLYVTGRDALQRAILVIDVDYGGRAYDSRTVKVKWLSYAARAAESLDGPCEMSASLEHVEMLVTGGRWTLSSRGPPIEEYMQ